MIAMGGGGGGGGGRLGRPVLSPGKILTSQFLTPPHFTQPTYDIFKKKLIENIENACGIKFDVAYCYISHRHPNRETRVGSSAGSVCCFLEQETFTPHKYW